MSSIILNYKLTKYIFTLLGNGLGVLNQNEEQSPFSTTETGLPQSNDHDSTFQHQMQNTPTVAVHDSSRYRHASILPRDLSKSMWERSGLRSQWSSTPNFEIPFYVDNEVMEEAKRNGEIDIQNLIRGYGRRLFTLDEVLGGGNLSGIHNQNMSPDSRRLKKIVRKVSSLFPRMEKPDQTVRTVLTTMFKNARSQARADKYREEYNKQFD